MLNKGLLYAVAIIVFFVIISQLLLNGGSVFQHGMQRSEMSENITAADIPNEQAKDEIIRNIQSNQMGNMANLIRDNFPLVDVVAGKKNESAHVYGTKKFTLSELKDVLVKVKQPEKISDVKGNQQILIYPEYFITLKVDQNDADVLLIEVASNGFVKRNYAPSFLHTYFTYRLLDGMLGHHWSTRRGNMCRSGGCYGGYTGHHYEPNGTPRRGHISFRGGGPGAGK